MSGTQQVAAPAAATAGAQALAGASIEALRVQLASKAVIVDDVDVSVRPGEIVGLVGESGSGKTTVGMALLAYTRQGATIVGGVVLVGGEDVLKLEGEALRSIRGRRIAYVPQDPTASMDPSLRIGEQLDEVIAVHKPEGSRSSRRPIIDAALAAVSLPCDDEFLGRYPHEVSGGQLQRVQIAAAILLDPEVIFFDEPTTGLDVST